MNLETKSTWGLASLFTTQPAPPVTVNVDANVVRIHTAARTPEESQRLAAAAHKETAHALAKLRSILAAEEEVQHRRDAAMPARQVAARTVACLVGLGVGIGGAVTQSVAVLASGAGVGVLSLTPCNPGFVVAFAQNCRQLNAAYKGREDLFGATDISSRVSALEEIERTLYPVVVANEVRLEARLPAEVADIIAGYAGPENQTPPPPDQQAMR